MVTYGSEMRMAFFRSTIPATRNTIMRGPFVSQASRKLPGTGVVEVADEDHFAAASAGRSGAKSSAPGNAGTASAPSTRTGRITANQSFHLFADDDTPHGLSYSEDIHE